MFKQAMNDHSDNSPERSNAPSRQDVPEIPDQEQDDPVWQLLGNASKQEPSSFFARNVIRETRALAQPTLATRLQSLFTSKRLLALSCSCLLVILGIQLWPSHQPGESTSSNGQEVYTEPSLALSELIIEENLNAAAEDPSIYTRDEIVAMIGF